MGSTTLRSAALTPAVVGFLASKHVRAQRAPIYRMLQRLDPVHRSPLGVTILSCHADVDRTLRDPTMASDERRADLSLLRLSGVNRLLGSSPRDPDDAAFTDLLGKFLMLRDPPDHTRLRALVARAFTPRRVDALAPRIEAIAADLLDRLLAKPSADFLTEFAYPFPARVICELLGVPDNDADRFIHHAPALAVGLDPAPMRTADGVRRAATATRELRSYLADLIATRRSTPTDDLLSALVHAETDGTTLSEDELIAMVLLLVVAGHETTANVLGTTNHRLVQDSNLRHAIADLDDAGMRAVVEEALRLDGPVQMAERITTTPTEIAPGITLDAGTIVICLVGAANHDPAVFTDPDQFLVTRTKNPHLAFGAGAHFCIGAPLARLELRIALRLLAQQLPEMTAVVGRPRTRPSFTVSGLETLHLRWR